MKIIKTFTFDSAHQLWNDSWTEEHNCAVYGKCTNLHGHTYKLEIVVSGQPDPESGMIMNFRDLGEVVKENILARYDHHFLNNLPEFVGKPTTSEIIAKEIFNRLEPILLDYNVALDEIRLSETPTSEAIVTSEDK
jgi:6-pyruvoyltetrahydropterin/6-carboxytetrahydropterin synthase